MADAVEGTVVGGRYRVQKLLGVGGSASVYEGEDLTFGRIVALKIPHDNVGPNSVAAKRLVREAQASGAVGHPNVCEVSEIGALPNGTPFVVMERLLGETLRDRISREGRLPFGDVVDIIMQVLSGLGAAHERGIIHRDVKPENIFLVRRAGCPALVKVLDFGLVTDARSGHGALPQPGRSGRSSAAREDLTATGMVVGTPNYLAPEQLLGGRNFDARVDLYACGVVLYEVTTGRRPFVSENVGELFKQIMNAWAPAVSSLRADTPTLLAAVITRAMAVDPAARFATASAFQRALAEVRAAPPTPSSVTPFKAVAAAIPPPDAASDVSPMTRVEGRTGNPPIMIESGPDEDWEQQTDWDQPTLKSPFRGE